MLLRAAICARHEGAAGVMEARHHLFELAKALLGLGGIARIRREETDAVVASIIGQISLEQ